MSRFTKEEAGRAEEALNAIMKGIPKSKVVNFIGEFNDLFLFISAVKAAAPSEKK